MSLCYGYRSDFNTIFALPSLIGTPCPSGLGCCAFGDTCLSNGICHFTHALEAGNFYSGFYIGSCSDPTFTNPACPRHCTSQPIPDVTYNYTSGQWACCGKSANGKISCNLPTTEIFSAPAPDNLTTVTSISSSTSTNLPTSSATVSSSGVASPTLSSTPAPSFSSAKPSSNTNSPSTGAIVGIAIGAVAGALIISLTSIWLYKRRKHARQATAYEKPELHSESIAVKPSELDSPRPMHELDGSTYR